MQQHDPKVVLDVVTLVLTGLVNRAISKVTGGTCPPWLAHPEKYCGSVFYLALDSAKTELVHSHDAGRKLRWTRQWKEEQKNKKKRKGNHKAAGTNKRRKRLKKDAGVSRRCTMHACAQQPASSRG